MGGLTLGHDHFGVKGEVSGCRGGAVALPVPVARFTDILDITARSSNDTT